MKKIHLNAAGFATSDGVIRVYHINPKKNEYIRESDEYLSIGVGIPAYSYVDAPPPAKSGFAVCRINGDWEYVEDYRGVDAYSVRTLELVEITVLGALPADVTTLRPATPFDRWSGDDWVIDEVAKRLAAIDAAKYKKCQRELKAKEIIEKLADALDLNMAVEGDESRLTEWRKYRVLLNQLDINTASDITWPQQPAE